jgi:amidase
MLSETDIAVIGPLARSADDLALVLDIVAGPDADRATARRLGLPQPRQGALREYRVAAWLDDPACSIDRELQAASRDRRCRRSPGQLELSPWLPSASCGPP